MTQLYNCIISIQKYGTCFSLFVLSQCLSSGDIRTAGSKQMVTWWYVKECKIFFFLIVSGVYKL